MFYWQIGGSIQTINLNHTACCWNWLSNCSWMKVVELRLLILPQGCLLRASLRIFLGRWGCGLGAGGVGWRRETRAAMSWQKAEARMASVWAGMLTCVR